MTKGAFQSVQNLVFSNLTAKTPRFDVATAIPCPTGSAHRRVGTLPKRSRQWACEQGRAPTRLPRVSRPPRRISGALHPVSLPRAVPIVMGAVTGPQNFSVHRDRAFRWRTFGFPITSPAPGDGWLTHRPCPLTTPARRKRDRSACAGSTCCGPAPVGPAPPLSRRCPGPVEMRARPLTFRLVCPCKPAIQHHVIRILEILHPSRPILPLVVGADPVAMAVFR